MQTTHQMTGWDDDPEYGSDEWSEARGYEIATAYGSSWDDQMEAAGDIAQSLRELRDKKDIIIQQQATEIDHLHRDLLLERHEIHLLRIEKESLHKALAGRGATIRQLKAQLAEMRTE